MPPSRRIAASAGQTPVLFLIAGPNGAGKSRFVEHLLAPVVHLPFVNADLIAAEHWPDEQSAHAYEAAQMAASIRSRLIEARRSFITETVFSHASKVELVAEARASGYLVELHVILVPVELAVARTRLRIAQGGHSVPEDRVRERYDRLWPLIVDAMGIAQVCHVWDASLMHYREILTSHSDSVTQFKPWPQWTPPALQALS